MPISARTRAGVAALAIAGAIAVAALPAIGQDRPESLLPPGFGDAQPTPAPRPTGNAPANLLPGAPQPGAVVQPLPSDTPSPTPTPSATPTIDAATLARFELPAASRRSLALVGPVAGRETGFAADAFGSADGAMLEAMMRRASVPLPSRWLSITLRRLLASEVDTPRGLNGADFAAERAWLLLRMGEAPTARAVVQSVDTGNYTAKLFEVAMNAMLATGDPAGLCPLADRGQTTTGERGWALAQAMCAGLAGAPGRAAPLIAAARRRHVAGGIDLALARKVVGAGPDGGRAVAIEWAGVDRLSVWRFGLALATGAAVPDTMLAAAAPQVRLWRANAPQLSNPERLAAAEAAAAQGVLSGEALVDLYGAVMAMDDPPAAAAATAADLATAYAGATGDDRLTALAGLWGADRPAPFARLVLTARAAARIAPASGVRDADRLVAAMLTAGLDRTAARWRGSVPVGGDAWAMLALGDPDGGRLTYRDLAGYTGGQGDAALKQRLFFAGLAGLGRLAPTDLERSAQALGVPIGTGDSWTRALDRAARERQPGTVVVLAALGMQTPAWRGVPPAMLYRIVAALRVVGLDGVARMVAAEALARA